MNVYSIIADGPNALMNYHIQERYSGNFYKWTESVSFIRTTESAREVTLKLDVKQMSADGNVTGSVESVAVIQVGADFWGWAPTALWEWIVASLAGSLR